MAESTDRHPSPVFARLEALLQPQGPQADNPEGFWTSIQAVMDGLGDDPGPLNRDNGAETRGETQAIAPEDGGSQAHRRVRLPVAMGQQLNSHHRPVASVLEPRPSWQEVLMTFGPEIQRIRQSQGLSLEQIHLKTQVPLYHLQSLESGQVDRLPEEIFVRGFLGRICKQLGSEGKMLLATLPVTQAAPQEILAHWQASMVAEETHLDLRSSHLYLGYATLLVGAAGGLALSFQVAEQAGKPGVAPIPVSQNAAAQAKFNPAQSIARLTFGFDMARPEQTMPELTPQ